MAKDLTLARRVQLAALAYIRHTKTRYDELLKETDWANARKAVEKPCLDIIVKWRGDEETGRDQLDEILREVIEISDSEEDSEEDSSSPESETPRSTPQSVRAVSTAAPTSSRVSLLNAPVINSLATARGHRHTPVQRVPLTPARQKVMTRVEKRTARKAAQRFRRYAAIADSIAHENEQSGHNGLNRTSHLPPTVDLTDSPASHRPAPSTREPFPAAYYVVPSGHGSSRAHMDPELMHVNASQAGDVRWPLHASEDRDRPSSPALRVMENQQPRAGPSPPTQNGPPIAMSPITNGLQDMLLPSIEALSPNVSGYSQSAPRTFHREYQGRVEALPVTSQAGQIEGFTARPRSPPYRIDGDERASKRSRIITYFPEDYEAPSGSRVAPLDYARVGAGSRFVPFGSSSAGVNVVRRAENTRNEQPIAISTRDYVTRTGEEFPTRTTTDPIAARSNAPYHPRRLVEIREQPARGRYNMADLSRPREVVYDPSVASSRIQPADRPYHDERIVSNHQHSGGAQNYVEDPRRLQESPMPPLPMSEAYQSISQARPSYPSYQPVRYREVPQSGHYVRRPIERTGSNPRDTHTAPQKPSQFEM